MNCRIVHVTAPSRLHFGLLSFGNPDALQFGGAGVMISKPRITLTVSEGEGFRVRGLHAERVEGIVRRWLDHCGLSIRDLDCEISVKEAPREHVGLGLGTQLSLAVATGLNAMLDRPQPAPDMLAASVGRGRRSAVGTHGFLRGGLIVERGKRSGESLGQLDRRLQLPADWCVLLVCPKAGSGLAGAAEKKAFAQLPTVPTGITDRLETELFDRLVPAAAEGRFAEFSESVYTYGKLAGECFASWQGGPFATPQLADRVQRIRAMGVSGVGQSSWGPTLFAWLPDRAAAESFSAEMRHAFHASDIGITIAQVNNQGRCVELNTACT